MSKVNENVKNKDAEEVVESTETQEIAVVEKKKFNLGPKMKKGLKIAGVAGLGVLSFLLGAKWAGRSNNESDDVDDVEYEIEVIDDDNNQ